MKANQFIKSVAAVTTLGVFIAGCSGGDGTTTRATSTTPTTSTRTTLPTASGGTPSVGGGGTVSVGGNAVIDDVAAKQVAQDAKLDEILAQSKASASAAKSAKNKANWAMWLGVGIASAIGIGAIANAVRESRSEAAKDKDSGVGFFSGLLNSKTGQTTDVANKTVKAAEDRFNERLNKTDQTVSAVKSEVESARAETNQNFEGVGADMTALRSDTEVLKAAAGLNIVATFSNLKATAAVGAKSDQLLKGQDQLAAQERIIKTNIEKINATAIEIKNDQAEIKTSQIDSQNAQIETSKKIAAMNQQLSDAKEAASQMKTALSNITAQVADEKLKSVVAETFKTYERALDTRIASAESNLSDAMKKSGFNNAQIADVIAGKVALVNAATMMQFNAGRGDAQQTSLRGHGNQNEEDMGREFQDLQHPERK